MGNESEHLNKANSADNKIYNFYEEGHGYYG